MVDDTPDYFLDNYGECAGQQPCQCLRPGCWLGRMCPHWRPLGVPSHEELSSHFEEHA